MPSKRLILCHPLLLLPSILPSIRVFSNELALHQVAKVLNFCFSLSTSNEYSGLISFRIDWFDLLVVQGILKSLLQHHSLKASILQGSGFFMIQLSQFSSVQFSGSVVSDNLWPHGLQHARPPCPKPTPRVYSNSCPQSQRCQATISSSVIPFFSSHQSFLASGSFQMSHFFASGGQTIGVSSASASVLPMNTQDWFPLGWTGWSTCSPRESQESSPTPQVKSINSSALSFLYSPALTYIHDYWKNHSFD